MIDVSDRPWIKPMMLFLGAGLIFAGTKLAGHANKECTVSRGIEVRVGTKSRCVPPGTDYNQVAKELTEGGG